MRFICLLAFVSFMFLQQCKNKDNHTPGNRFERSDFKEVKTVSGESRVLPGIFRPVRIKIIPEYNLLLILESQGREYYGSVFTLDSIRFVQRFIKAGVGSGEQIAPISLEYLPNRRELYVFDLARQDYYYYKIDSLLQPSSGKASGSLRLISDRTGEANKKKLLNPVILQNNNEIVGIGHNKIAPAYHFDFYDSNLKFNRSSGTYPMSSGNLPPYVVSEYFLGRLKSISLSNKFVMSYYNADIISIFDSSGNILNSCYGPDNLVPDMSIKQVPGGTVLAPGKENTLAYLTSTGFNNGNIVALYCGKKTHSRDETSTELFEFSQKLIPLTHYHLTKKIFDFDINPITEAVYGLSLEGGPNVVIYKIH